VILAVALLLGLLSKQRGLSLIPRQRAN
jgi:hypothetical protein